MMVKSSDLMPLRSPVPGQPGSSGPRTLISVFPLAQTLSLMHEGTKTYRLEAAKKGELARITIPDTFAWIRNLSTGEFYQAPIPASAVAQNLLERWSTGMVGARDGHGPGIIICAGLEPTEDEIAAVSARQTEYFGALVHDADAHDARKENHMITDTHRMAAEWMGVMDRAWAKPLVHVELRDCPACAEKIKSQAKICRFCQTDLKKFELNEKALADREARQAAKEAQ